MTIRFSRNWWRSDDEVSCQIWSNLVKISPNLIGISSDLRLRQREWTAVFCELCVLLSTMGKEVLKKKNCMWMVLVYVDWFGWFLELMSKIYLICYYPLTEMSALRGQTSKAINKRKACVKISLKKLVFSEIHIYFFVVSARFRMILHPLCFVVRWFYSLNKAQNLLVFYFTSVELF